MMNNDANFIALLSAQREILKKLKSGESEGAHASSRHIEKILLSKQTAESMDCGEDDAADPFSLMNAPIIERRPSNFHERRPSLFHEDVFLQTVRSRRLSLVLVTDDNFDTFSFNTSNMEKHEVENRKSELSSQNELETPPSRKSTEQTRSISDMLANKLTLNKKHSSSPTTPKCTNVSIKRCTNVSIQKRGWDKTFVKPPKEGYVTEELDGADLTLLKSGLKFVLAMDKSTKSQQDIHNWDRMMGLKRSHSKTMRLSMRSRKELRKILKKR